MTSPATIAALGALEGLLRAFAWIGDDRLARIASGGQGGYLTPDMARALLAARGVAAALPVRETARFTWCVHHPADDVVQLELRHADPYEAMALFDELARVAGTARRAEIALCLDGASAAGAPSVGTPGAGTG